MNHEACTKVSMIMVQHSRIVYKVPTVQVFSNLIEFAPFHMFVSKAQMTPQSAKFYPLQHFKHLLSMSNDL